MPKDPRDHIRLLDERDQAQTAAATRARQHVEPERPGHEGCPPLAAGAVEAIADALRAHGDELTPRLPGALLGAAPWWQAGVPATAAIGAVIGLVSERGAQPEPVYERP